MHTSSDSFGTDAGLLQSAFLCSDDGDATRNAVHWPGERDFAVPIATDPRHDLAL